MSDIPHIKVFGSISFSLWSTLPMFDSSGKHELPLDHFSTSIELIYICQVMTSTRIWQIRDLCWPRLHLPRYLHDIRSWVWKVLRWQCSSTYWWMASSIEWIPWHVKLLFQALRKLLKVPPETLWCLYQHVLPWVWMIWSPEEVGSGAIHGLRKHLFELVTTSLHLWCSNTNLRV